jgi:hypothetical protein
MRCVHLSVVMLLQRRNPNRSQSPLQPNVPHLVSPVNESNGHFRKTDGTRETLQVDNFMLHLCCYAILCLFLCQYASSQGPSSSGIQNQLQEERRR